jgi:hypothetical protein
VSIAAIFQSTIRTLFMAPFLFLVIQTPQGITDALEDFVGKTYGETNVAVTAIYAIAAFIIGIIPEALTFAMVLDVSEGRKPSLSSALSRLKGKWGRLISAAILLGVVFALGVMAYFLPGLLLMTLYLFVPHLIIQQPLSPFATYFYRASKMAKKYFLRIFLFVIIAIVTFLLTQRLGATLGVWIPAASFLPVMFISMIVNAVVNIWLGYFFLTLLAKEAK